MAGELPKDAVLLIVEERERQQRQEGWSEAHDDAHRDGALATAAACYALPERLRAKGLLDSTLVMYLWPWSRGWWKPRPEDRVRELVKAGALIVAEIERLQRAAARGGAS